ncbi:MAG: Ion transport protein [Gammaproteobacteria bacterium]|nr:Ion transport protein [Gammaproteobacteria bacterium]
MAQNLFGLSRNRIYQILEFTDPEDRTSRFVSFGIVGLIIVNVLAIVLESIPSLYEAYEKTFFRLEIVSCIIFILEYVLRVWASVEDPETLEDESGTQITNGKRRINFMLKPLAIIDFLAFVPIFLQLLFPGVDLRFLRALRLLRVFKLTRYFQSFEMILEVLHDEWRSLAGTVFIMLVILVIAACGLYYIERDIQPDKFGSIPEAMWWAMAALTTVGYGDSYPITPIGKIIGSIVTLLGIGMVALPSGILASSFSERMRQRRESMQTQIDQALEDGLITREEELSLRKLGRDLGLNEEAISALVENSQTIFNKKQ